MERVESLLKFHLSFLDEIGEGCCQMLESERKPLPYVLHLTFLLKNVSIPERSQNKSDNQIMDLLSNYSRYPKVSRVFVMLSDPSEVLAGYCRQNH